MHRLIALVLLFLSINVFAQDVKTYIPTQAYNHIPTLIKEKVDNWHDHPRPEYLTGLIEHESCISLKHSRCWNPKSRLKSPREEGVGLGQITRAYTPTGGIRFDALAEIRDKHRELKDLSWSNVYDRPDLQIRAVVLKLRDNYQYYYRFTDPNNALVFGMVSYNGGVGGLDKERRACKISGTCDPSKWFGNVEHYCMKSKAILYGKRSACDINREYPVDIINNRSNKYKRFWVTEN